MEKNIKSKVIYNFYSEAHKYYSPNIKLEKTIIDSLVSEQQTTRFKSIRNIEIVKKRLGIYDEGNIVPLKQIGSINEQITYQRIGQLIKTTISNIYQKDAEIKAEIIKNNPRLQEKFKESDIENLEFDNKTTEIIRTKGYNKVKSLLELTEKELKKEFVYKDLNCKQIIKRLNLFGLQLKPEQEEVIKESDISKEAYIFLSKRNIFTYSQLQDEFQNIINEKIELSIKLEIMELQKKHNMQTNIYRNLIQHKKFFQQRIEQLEERKLKIQDELDKLLHSNIDIQDKSVLIKRIYENQNIIEEMIEKMKKEIDIIDEQIQIMLENHLPSTLKKKI